MNSSKQQGLKAPRNGDVPLPPEVNRYHRPLRKEKELVCLQTNKNIRNNR